MLKLLIEDVNLCLGNDACNYVVNNGSSIHCTSKLWYKFPRIETINFGPTPQFLFFKKGSSSDVTILIFNCFCVIFHRFSFVGFAPFICLLPKSMDRFLPKHCERFLVLFFQLYTGFYFSILCSLFEEILDFI